MNTPVPCKSNFMWNNLSIRFQVSKVKKKKLPGFYWSQTYLNTNRTSMPQNNRFYFMHCEKNILIPLPYMKQEWEQENHN